MQRQGLDPQQVDWLELTKGPTEHLYQYSHIDIALDPIPNGGCTTTCEALWMGVPTITYAGANYVSRMSTAVLSGAAMFDWIALLIMMITSGLHQSMLYGSMNYGKTAEVGVRNCRIVH